MMDTLRKLSILMWKNWLFRKRQYIMTAFEIILPTLFSLLLLIMRSQGGEWTVTHKNLTQYKPSNISKEFAYGQTFLFSPNTPSAKDLFYYITKQQGQLLGFDNEELMEAWVAKKNSSRSYYFAGISFKNFPNNSLPENLHYVIRYPAEWNWNTAYLTPQLQLPGPLDDYDIRQYQDQSFLAIQDVIAMRFIEKQTGQQNLLERTTLTEQQFPFPPYYDDHGFTQFMQTILPMFIVLSYFFISPTLIKYIVREKELGVKELMKLMGLPNWLQWCGWFASSFIMMTISAIIILLFLCVKFSTTAVLPKSSPVLLFFIFLLYIASSICFCFFISTLFSKPTVATGIGTAFWLITYFVPYNLMNQKYGNLNLSSKLSVSIFPNMAMAWICRLVSAFEGQQIGLQWSNLSEPSYPGDTLTALHLLFMFCVDIFFYSFLTWYMDNVFPGVYGISKPWYFLFTKTYWCGSKPKYDSYPMSQRNQSRNFETEPVNLEAIINIENLTKNFGTNGKLAVDNLNLNIYEGQITALLGHNGAGKTTTMSMLTGMFNPTSGTAYINGYDICKDIDKARENLGLCPQHNMLFSNLTVWEHLLFFGKLKKMTAKALAAEIPIILHKLQLYDKKDTLSMKLSGGMKRKLSLAIALIGKPKVLILDEPTSGMDPEARRSIWDLLQEIRPGRCVVLSTHFMEEADVLGDRIAIMAHGQVECCGSPLFLKKRYGAGYHLNVVKGTTCKVEAITNLIQSHLPDAHVKSNTSTDLVVILPNEESQKFPTLFRELEKDEKGLGISNFGVSVTTMEEVFLKVGETCEEESDRPNETGSINSSSYLIENGNTTEPKLSPKAENLYLEQIRGLFLKRWYYCHRRWTILIAQILLPVISVIMVLTINNQIGNLFNNNQPSRLMDISQYGDTEVIYKGEDQFVGAYNSVFPVGTTFHNLNESAEKYLEYLGQNDYVSYAKKHIVGAEFPGNNTENSSFNANIWFNGLYYHSQPLSLNLYHNAIAKFYSKNSNLSLTVENFPFPRHNDDSSQFDADGMTRSIMIAIFIPLGLSFLSSSFVVFPIHERASQAKHLQLMTGVGGFLFWGTSFIWDFATHMVSSCIILIIFATTDNTNSFTGGEKTGIVFLLLMLYGWASIPFTYLASFVAKLPATGFSRLNLINNLASVLMSMLVFFFITAAGMSGLVNAAKIMQWIFRLLPTYSVTMSFIEMVQVTSAKKTCQKSPDSCKDVSYFQWDFPGILQEVIALLVIGAVYFILLALIERGTFYELWYSICKCRRRPPTSVVYTYEENTSVPILDNDVILEQERVNNMIQHVEGNSNEDVLVVNNLSKQFSGFTAVDGLSFGVKNSECFGLLGVNGAGKTTTFQMLTGGLVLSAGDAFMNGISLKTNYLEFLRQIGYCPQFDALLDYLTGREMLTVFAHLRGIPNHLIKFTVDTFLKKFDLKEHADKITLAYSGGTKRKLSAALAFIGDPPIIFLDEPTTGVDPVARRKIWDILTQANQNGISVVLTSHSMEECEVLCQRIAIMVNGQFQCIGGIQYLKNKFSQGFNVLAKLKHNTTEVLQQSQTQIELQRFIEAQFPSASLKDVHQGLVQYQITDVNTKWAHLFEIMEEAKVRFNLEDYSISQATLEQVFLSFARKQRVLQIVA